MTAHKLKSSKIKNRPEVDPVYVQDDLERDILEVVNEDQINIEEKLQPIFTAVRMQPNNGNTREDVANKYDTFLKSVSQVMGTHNIISINIGHFIDPHSVNSPDYAYLELTPRGVFANHCDGTVKVGNVLDVLYDLEEPKQILRNLIYQITKETNVNKMRISKLESSLEFSERIIKNINSPSNGSNKSMASNKEQFDYNGKSERGYVCKRDCANDN
jgi:hypothetical protein